MTSMPDTSTALVWDLPTRLFHWCLVAAFAGAWLTSDDEGRIGLHLLFGYSLFALILFRVLWGLVGSRYARFRQFVRGPAAVFASARGMIAGKPEHSTGHNPVGAWAVVLLLSLGLATAITGALMATGIAGESVEDVHEVFANIFLAVICVHILGVIVGSVLHRENLARAMVTGRKRAGTDGGIASSFRAVAIVMVLELAGFWGYALTTGSLPFGLDVGVQAHGNSSDGD